MSQTEQGKAYRAREVQVAELTTLFLANMSAEDANKAAEATVQEIETRNAEEQRRKDAEGSIPCHQYFIGGYWVDCSPERYSQFRLCPTRILYSHPANVAALEARVKVLVGALAKVDYAARKDSLIDAERLESVRSIIRATLTREGGE